ncbi:hypothetical protein HZC53_02925 [Candidatus Uhrbacteria bacterium]|nr:hypothetical protein [Candidatus Uhrbacteria bacterium]
MSGSSHHTYRARTEEAVRSLTDSDPAVVSKARRERSARIEDDKRKIVEEPYRTPPKRDEREVYDSSLVRLKVNAPDEKAERVHIVLIDNSGSNEKIAEHLKKSSGYLLAVLKAIDPASRICFVYFSDHCDGPRIWQAVDYVAPDEQGDKILHSSIRHVDKAGGGDEPEAIECALWDACDLPFGHVQERRLYLVTDVVAHGMGLRGDGGCPHQRDWKESLKRVHETFLSFEVIGCGAERDCAELQKKFILDKKRLPFDLIDLSAIKSHEHRCGITGNSLLFLIARHQGVQTVEAFLMTLYEKWLAEPIFGANTDTSAREAIRRFGKYVEAPEEDVQKMLDKIFS